MLRAIVSALAKTAQGIVTALRARPRVFLAVALGVFVFNLFLPVAILSLVRKPVDSFTINPWLSRLPEWLASDELPVAKKLEFLSGLALAWFSAESDNPMVGREWGFIVDVVSIGRFILTSLLFGAYFALWFYWRDQVGRCGWRPTASRHGGVMGVLTSVLGFSTGPCSVTGCGVPVLPVVGLAFTGLSTDTLKVLAGLSRGAVTAVLVVVTLTVGFFGWLVGATGEGRDRRSE